MTWFLSFLPAESFMGLLRLPERVALGLRVRKATLSVVEYWDGQGFTCEPPSWHQRRVSMSSERTDTIKTPIRLRYASSDDLLHPLNHPVVLAADALAALDFRTLVAVEDEEREEGDAHEPCAAEEGAELDVDAEKRNPPHSLSSRTSIDSASGSLPALNSLPGATRQSESSSSVTKDAPWQRNESERSLPASF